MNKLRRLPTPLRLYLLALVLRLIPVLLTSELAIGLDDMFQYDMLARSMAEGKGFRWYAQEDLELVRSYVDLELVVGDYDPQGILASFRAPGYPAFLALVYSVFGMAGRFFAARLVQAFVGASLAPLVYAISRRAFPKQERGAVIAGLAMACYPMLVIYPLALATENTFIPLTLSGILLLLVGRDKDSVGLFGAAGLALGLATLTRSVIFAFAGLAALWVWWASRNWRAVGLYALALLVVVSPWVARNTLLHERFTFVENSLGYNLHMGYHPLSEGTFQYGISLELFPYIDDGLRNEIGVEAGLSFIRDDPGRIPQLMLNKLSFFMGLEKRGLSYFYSNGFFGAIPSAPLLGLFLLFTLPFALLSSLAALGLGMGERGKAKWLLAGMLLAYTGPHLLLLAEPRFHLAIVPVLAIFAGQAAAPRNEWRSWARDNRAAFALAALAIGLLWLNWSWELSRDAEMLRTLFGPDGHRAGFSY